MNLRNSTTLLFAFPIVSCGTVSSFSNLAETAKKTSQTPSSSEQSALNPSNPQDPQNPQNPPVPPVEVTGSFLTGVLFDESAAEIPDAKLKIKETNFQTQTDTKGRFKLPLKMIPPAGFKLEIQKIKNLPSVFNFSLPADIKLLADKLRNSATRSELPRSLAIMLPEPTTAGTGTKNGTSSPPDLLSLGALSLPNSSTAMSFVPFWGLINLSTGKEARFKWVLPRLPVLAVKLAISAKPETVSGWDALSDMTVTRSGGIVISDFSNCTSAEQVPASGPFTAQKEGTCALSFSTLPLNLQDKFYFRLAVTESSITRLSHVFSAAATSAAEPTPPPTPPPTAAPAPAKTAFEFTGALQNWTSPRAATATAPIIIKAWGAGGGSLSASAPGGGSGFVQLKITSGISAGDNLSIYVAGAGKLGTGSRAGAGGGGATAVLVNGKVLLISAGGGGASAGSSGLGGAGGGQSGEQGGPDNCAGGIGGFGANGATSGAGGPSNRNYSAGTSGSDGNGGTGGSGNGGVTQTATGGWGFKTGGDSGSVPNDGGGGGGGAGYGGGGGGGGGCWGMGGGGGSSFFDSTAGNGSTVSGAGAQTGNSTDADNLGAGAASKHGRVVILQ